MTDPTRPKDGWDKFQIVGTVLALVAVPVVIGLVGNWVSVSLKERDVRLKTVELAISILNENPKSAPETPELRRWAMTVIDQFSGIDLPGPAKQELEKSALPAAEWGESKFIQLFKPKTVSCPTTNFEFQGYASDILSVEETPEGCVILLHLESPTDGTPTKCPTVKGTLYAPEGWKIVVREEGGKCEMRYVPDRTPTLMYWSPLNTKEYLPGATQKRTR